MQIALATLRPIALAFVLLVLPQGSRGDVLHLSDGTRIEGDVKKGPEGWVVTDARGKVTVVPAGKVKSIEVKPTAKPGGDAAMEKLFSLRRSVENIASVADVIERYKRFIDQNAGTEIAKEAQADLAVWQDRLSRKLVKVGGKWVTPQELAEMRDQSFAVASEARELIKDGRIKEAESVIAKALAVDPSNASALYLRGVLEYRAGKMPAARKAFEAVNDVVPGHAPTLNNLAVVLSRQNQHAASLGMYDKAMEAAPLDRDILNNVAEALYALPDDAKKAQLVQRAAKRFIEQDEQLQAEMRKAGQYRWGSTWVDQSKLDELKEAEGQVKGRLDQLAVEFDAAQARITTINQEIDANGREMRRLESRSYTAAGQAALPRRYYDLQADNETLLDERKQQEAKLQQLRAAAREVQKQLPTPKYTGTQKLIETEGTPAVFPGAAGDEPTTQAGAAQAATAPATNPAP